MNREEGLRFWRSPAGIRHLTPRRKPLPEGRVFRRFMIDRFSSTDVLDYGCGEGRLAPFFSWASYLGVDISRIAVDRARLLHPDYRFRIVTEDEPLPTAEVVIAHTVLLHEHDDSVSAVAERLLAAAPIVAVSEVMDRKWRRPGLPPAFNRYPDDYEDIFRRLGAERLAATEIPYEHYPDTVLTILEFFR